MSISGCNQYIGELIGPFSSVRILFYSSVVVVVAVAIRSIGFADSSGGLHNQVWVPASQNN